MLGRSLVVLGEKQRRDIVKIALDSRVNVGDGRNIALAIHLVCEEVF